MDNYQKYKECEFSFLSCRRQGSREIIRVINLPELRASLGGKVRVQSARRDRLRFYLLRVSSTRLNRKRSVASISRLSEPIARLRRRVKPCLPFYSAESKRASSSGKATPRVAIPPRLACPSRHFTPTNTHDARSTRRRACRR